MKLLFLNALKGLKKKKIQMFGIIVMVMLSTAVYVGMNGAVDRLEDKYYEYLEEQNVEHVSFGVVVDYQKDVTYDEFQTLKENEFQNVTEEEKALLDQYELLINPYVTIEYIENPLNNPSFLYGIQSIFEKYDADLSIKNKKIDEIKEKYDFRYEVKKSKTVSDDEVLSKILVYNENDNINKAYLVEGEFPKNDLEITMLPGFAKNHDIKIGDFYQIGDIKYKVVGFTYAPDYIYPLISFSMPIFDENKNNIIYMNQNDFKQINGILEKSYSLLYNHPIDRKFEITVSMGDEKPTNDDPMYQMFEDEKDTLTMDLSTITRIGRIGALQIEFASDRLFAEYFLYVLLIISILIIIVITKKRIDDERLQIGVLKSLGYNRFSIAFSYLVYPIVGSLIGGLLGFLIGFCINEPISNILVSFYTVPLSNYAIDMNYLKTAILVPTITLSLLSYLIAFIMLRKKPLQLLKEGSNLKVNIFSKIIRKLTSKLPFDYHFKYSLAFRSLGKLFIVSITSFCTGLLIVLVLIGYNLFDNMIETSFSGMNYEYIVALNQLDFKESGGKEDFVLSSSSELKSIEDKSGTEKKIKEDTSISITGLDTKPNFIEVVDKEKKNLLLGLDNDSIIMNENVKEFLNVELGDTLTFMSNNQEFSYKVIGFSSEYMGLSGYVTRNSLSNHLGFGENAYNQIYSKDPKYQKMSNLSKEESNKIGNVLSLKDLKSNIGKQMDRFNGSVYIIIAFASVMTLVIISVIANIVVEENKKTISLMKVMGYKNKKISSIVLNIYTPFLIIAYLLSIPIMTNILKAIVKALVGDIEITIPIALDPILAILGLVGLLIAYYIALAFSKRVLNKIPLAMALKRE